MKSKLSGAQAVRVSEHGQLTDSQNSLSKAPVRWSPKIYFHRLGIKAISWWVAGQVPTNRGLWHFAYVELKAFEKQQMLEETPFELPLSS